jgi:hypothetical protein
MGTKSRETICGASIRASAERAAERSHLVALRSTKISASDPPSTWWPGER